MKVKTQYVRKGKTIRNLENKESLQYKSINEAKRVSRKLQAGAMGYGAVRKA